MDIWPSTEVGAVEGLFPGRFELTEKPLRVLFELRPLLTLSVSDTSIGLRDIVEAVGSM